MEELAKKLLTPARIIRANKNGTLNQLKNAAIERLIGTRYSYGEEIAIERQKDEKPAEAAAHYVFCELCKDAVKARIKEVTGVDV